MDDVDKILASSKFVVSLCGDYVKKHGKFPSGRHAWAFRIGNLHQIERAELYGLPCVMDFTEAEKIAQEVARKLGFTCIYVEP